jgi:predicted dinucleotide-binding enzyme
MTSPQEEARGTTAVVGVGHIGHALARHLVEGGESVVLAAEDPSHARAVAAELGPQARAASVDEAITAADAVVFAVWLDVMKELIADHGAALEGKVVVDPSNPLGFDANGQMIRALPEGQSSGSVVASRLPAGAHYVKAFGTLGADALASAAHRDPRVVLFYATDDDLAATAVERLISAAGFEPLRAGGLADAGRLEVPGGDLHQGGGLNGRLLDLHEARVLIGSEVSA